MRYKTGDIAPLKGNYNWDGYADGSRYPSPTANEKQIPMDQGDTFPPVKSCEKAAYWTYVYQY